MKTFRAVLALMMVALLLAGCSGERRDRDRSSDFFEQMMEDLMEKRREEADDSLWSDDDWSDDEWQDDVTEGPDVTEDPYDFEEWPPPTTESVIPVTLKVWAPSEDQYGDGSWLYQMEEEFQLQHPEYSITWINEVCNEADAGSLVSADPSAAADVYMFVNDQMGTLINAGALCRLGGEFEEQVKYDNSRNMINTVTHTDGCIYGFPVTSNTWFLYYNKDIFTEEDVQSLDTMLSKGKVAFQWGTGWYSGAFFLANGGQLFGDMGIDAAAGIQFGANNGGYEAALKMVQLANHPNFVNDTDMSGCSGLIDGTIGAYFSGSWDYAYLSEYLGDRLGAAQPPMVEIDGQQKQMKAFVGSKVVGINPWTAHPALATEFAAFLASVDAQKARYEIRGVIPAAMVLAYDWSVCSNPVAAAQINTVTYAGVVQPTIPEMGRYWTPVGNFGGLLANGSITAENYKEQVDQMMEALNSDGL